MINEVFGEHYSGQEKITFSPNEHFLNQQGGNEDERITDTSFKIEGKETKKYHPECQSSTDNSMLVRFFEYDTQIALDTRCTIIDMSNKVLEHIAVKYDSVKEGAKAVMGGKVLEYEAKTIKREGIEQGEDKLSKLIAKLMENKRSQDVIRVTNVDFWLEKPQQMLEAIDSYEIMLSQKDKDVFYIDVEENTDE